MVNWVCDDSKVVTAVSDSSLCVWDPNTQVNIISLQGFFLDVIHWSTPIAKTCPNSTFSCLFSD